MSITRWQPHHDVTRTPQFLDSVFELPLLWPVDEYAGGILPEMDVREAGDRYVVTMSLPGFRPDDIDVDVHGRRLTVSATMHDESERHDTDHRWWIRERRTGNVRRSITLPVEIDAERAGCDYHDGVLEISLPKDGASRSHRIPVQAGRTLNPRSRKRSRLSRFLQRFRRT